MAYGQLWSFYNSWLGIKLRFIRPKYWDSSCWVLICSPYWSSLERSWITFNDPSIILTKRFSSVLRFHCWAVLRCLLTLSEGGKSAEIIFTSRPYRSSFGHLNSFSVLFSLRDHQCQYETMVSYRLNLELFQKSELEDRVICRPLNCLTVPAPILSWTML